MRKRVFKVRKQRGYYVYLVSNQNKKSSNFFFITSNMKTFVFIVFLLAVENLPAQKNGYYISLEGDTIHSFIHLRKDVFGPYSLHSIYKEVRLSEDSASAEKIFTPGTIQSFFVRTPNGNYTLFSKPTEKDEQRFMQPLVVTPQTSLYSYSELRTSKALGVSERIYYTIERPDSNYLFVFSRNHVKLKKELREFYAGDQKILELLEPLFKQPGYTDRDLLLFFKRIKGLP